MHQDIQLNFYEDVRNYFWIPFWREGQLLESCFRKKMIYKYIINGSIYRINDIKNLYMQLTKYTEANKNTYKKLMIQWKFYMEANIISLLSQQQKLCFLISCFLNWGMKPL